MPQRVAPAVALISQDERLRQDARDLLVSFGYEVCEEDGAAALFEHAPSLPLEAILVDMSSDRAVGCLRTVVAGAGSVPVIAVSRSPGLHLDPSPLELGARHHVTDAHDREALRRSLVATLPKRKGAQPLAPYLHTRSEESFFVAASPVMMSLKATAKRVAETDITTLIRGESGVGKEVLANYIHENSPRYDRPFVKVNCAALPEDLLESELFGHEQGAFTGATTARPGKFELANHGTILLDEIAEMRVSLQAKLLHVLQDGTFSRLGGQRDISVDVRVLSATNRNLEEEIKRGQFREDLYFRLKVIDLFIPPLRDRLEDIPVLVDKFTERYATQYGSRLRRLSEPMRGMLMRYDWQGNVRELDNLVKGIFILDDEAWAREQLEERLRGRENSTTPTGGRSSTGERAEERSVAPVARPSLKQVARDAARLAERDLIHRTLQETRWNRRKAARLLQVSYRTLLTKIKDCGLAERE